jgi:hypothetical protein
MNYDWPCIHRGPATGERIACGCGMEELQPIYRCLHPVLGGRCVIRMNKPAVKDPRGCSGCDFREEPPRTSVDEKLAIAQPRQAKLKARLAEALNREAEVKAALGNCQCINAERPEKPFGGAVVRNLCYHIAPFSGNGVWQRSVAQIRQRISLFNGRRIVGIVTGPGLDPPEQVQEAFAGDVQEWIVQPNNRQLGEVVSFLPMLERVASRASREVTFYAHAKGVTRPVNSGVSVHRWAEIMYESLLDYWPRVESLLLRFPIAGSFKKLGRGFNGSDSGWHYSGAFYWLRNSEAFSRNWRKIDRRYWGSESWPGLHFLPDEAGCVFGQGGGPLFNLYDLRLLRDFVEPAYERWKAMS